MEVFIEAVLDTVDPLLANRSLATLGTDTPSPSRPFEEAVAETTRSYLLMEYTLPEVTIPSQTPTFTQFTTFKGRADYVYLKVDITRVKGRTAQDELRNMRLPHFWQRVGGRVIFIEAKQKLDEDGLAQVAAEAIAFSQSERRCVLLVKYLYSERF
jgi:hypothetical protein